MSAGVKPLLRGVVLLVGGGLLLAAVLLGWWLVRPLGWVYALATTGALASLLIGAGFSARGSAFGRWLMED
jgi:hypothetical protein